MSDEESKPTKIIHGDYDKYGIGSAVSSLCGTTGCLLVVVIIALLCTGNFTAVVLSLAR